MRSIVLVGFVILTCLAVGDSLQCYTCDYGCLVRTTTTCGALQACDSRTASKGDLKLKAKGCLDFEQCLTQSTNSILGIDYTVTHRCCVTDLCNAGAAVGLSLLAGLAVLLPMALLL